MKTDRQLRQDVLEELNWTPSIDATGVDVEVDDGDVTLIGCVRNAIQLWRVQHAVERMDGVQGVVMELVVDLAPSDGRFGDARFESERRSPT